MKKTQKNIDETLLLKMIEQTADEKEKVFFNSWIEESVMHAEYFEQFKKTYHLTSVDATAKEKSWEMVVAKVKSGKQVPDYIELPIKSADRKLIFLSTPMRVAASLLFLIGVAVLLKFIVFKTEQFTISGKNLKPNEAYVLADGSKVYLHGNSSISFTNKFGLRNRNVTLTGEAFFEVKHDEKNPFTITTFKTTTQVLGTNFNVFSDSTGKVKVSVVTGEVAFYKDKKEQGVKLIAGEQGTYLPGSTATIKDENKDPNFQSWKTGIFYFRETPVSKAFEMLQTYYPQVFVFESGQNNDPTLTTTFDNQPLEAVLEELNLLLNTKNVSRNDTIFFKTNY